MGVTFNLIDYIAAERGTVHPTLNVILFDEITARFSRGRTQRWKIQYLFFEILKTSSSV